MMSLLLWEENWEKLFGYRYKDTKIVGTIRFGKGLEKFTNYLRLLDIKMRIGHKTFASSP